MNSGSHLASPNTTTSIEAANEGMLTSIHGDTHTTTRTNLGPTLARGEYQHEHSSSRDIPNSINSNQAGIVAESVTKATPTWHSITVRTSSGNGSIAIVTSEKRHGLNNLIYIGVVVAIIIIMMTVMCGVYVFFFKDKPRENNNTPPPEVQLNNCYMNDSLYEADQAADVVIDDDPSLEIPEEPFTTTTFSVSNGNAAIPLPFLPKSMKDEPPLTTSTPIIRSADRYGFAYENPSFTFGDDKQSSSDEDASQADPITEPLHSGVRPTPPNRTSNGKVDDSDGVNGGYMIPVMKTDMGNGPATGTGQTVEGTSLPPIPETPEPGETCESPPCPTTTCIGENIENERRRNGDTTSSSDGYERIPADELTRPADEVTRPADELTRPAAGLDEIPENTADGDRTLTNGTHTYEEIPADLLPPLVQEPETVSSEAPVENISEDLIAFMTNRWTSCGVPDDEDPNATYDKADMFTPATPPSMRNSKTDSGKNGDIPCGQIPVTYDVPNDVNISSPIIPNRKCPDLITPNKQTKRKGFMRKDLPVSQHGNKVDDKACSFENIYETVKCEATLLDRTPSSKRRQILHSPVLPVKELEFSVIDLSDEEETSSTQQTGLVRTNEVSGGQPADIQAAVTMNGTGEKPEVKVSRPTDESLKLDHSERETLAGSSRDYGESDA